MNMNINPTGHPLSSKKWSEIPDSTPVKDIMEAITYDCLKTSFQT